MPYIGTELVDDEGVALLREWIASLDEKSNSDRLDVMNQIREPGGVAKHTANSSAALRLAHALVEPRVPLTVKEHVAMEARKSSNPLITELFDRFLPAEQRANVLQPTARRGAAVAARSFGGRASLGRSSSATGTEQWGQTFRTSRCATMPLSTEAILYPSRPRSRRRMTALVASFVCMVENTR